MHAPIRHEEIRPLYDLIRTDEHGNEYLMSGSLDRTVGEMLLRSFTNRGHKQFYELRQRTMAVANGL